MLVTRLPRIKWSHVWLSYLPFALWMFCLQVGQSTVVFSIKKFTDDASLIAWALVLFRLPEAIFTPLVSYASDHSWTHWGRRTPYIVASGVLGGVIVCFVPGMASAWGVIGVILGYQVMIYSSQVFNPLSQELVPLPQRGRASAIRALLFQFSIAVFFSIVIGRFDDVYATGPIARCFGPVTGEQFTYWLAGLMMLLTPLLVGLGVTELRLKTVPAGAEQPVRPRVSWRERATVPFRFVSALCSREYQAAYIVALALVLTLDLGSFVFLLYTEQWEYSKQEMGANIALGVVIMMPVIYVGGWLSDRFDKARAMLWSQLAQLAVVLFYIFYVKVWLGGVRPSLLEILVFGEIAAITKWMAQTMAWPLMYDYVQRDRMGTASAGISIINSLMLAGLISLMGWWIGAYSTHFGAPAGAETRVVLAQPATLVELATLIDPGTDARPVVIASSAGGYHRVWTLRRPDREMGQLLADLKAAESALAVRRAAPDGKAGSALAEMQSRIAGLQERLRASAADWESHVRERLASRLVTDGEELRAATWSEATVATVATKAAVDQKLLPALRKRLPGNATIDATATGPHFADITQTGLTSLRFTWFVGDGAGPAVDELRRRWQALMPPGDSTPGGFAVVVDPAGFANAVIRRAPVLALDMMTLNAPGPKQLGLMTEALAPGDEYTVHVTALPDETGVRLTVVFHRMEAAPTLPGPSRPTAAVRQRLEAAAALGPDAAWRTERSVAVYEQAAAEAGRLGLILRKPIVHSGARPLSYDYFAGYYLYAAQMIFSCGLTLWLIRLDRRGIVKKQTA